MALVDRFRALFAAPQTQQKSAVGQPISGGLPTLGAIASATGLAISQASAMSVGAVNACVKRRSEDVARCTPRLYRRDATGKRQKIDADQHPVARFFRRPNDYQTWFEFCEQMEVGKLLRGNGYAAIRRDGRGKFRDMIAINPDAVQVLEGYEGGIFYSVNRIGLWQMAMLRDFPTSLAAEDVFHLRDFSFNTLVAASTIGLARDSIGVAMGLEQQSARLMANGARPSVVLQAKKRLDADAAQRLKQSWNDAFRGLQNVGSTAVLEEGIEAKELQLTSVDMEFMAQKNYQVVDICRFFGVPPFKLGITELRGINIDQINQDYVNNTIMPDLHRWEQKLAQVFDLDDQDIEVSLDETVLLRADVTTRYTAARIALGGSAFVSVNEVRAGEGLPAADPDATGADAITRPVNVATLGSDITGTAPDGAGHPLAAEGGVPGADHVPPASAAPNGDDEG
jgi:HK97 family phage portal protein